MNQTVYQNLEQIVFNLKLPSYIFYYLTHFQHIRFSHSEGFTLTLRWKAVASLNIILLGKLTIAPSVILPCPDHLNHHSLSSTRTSNCISNFFFWTTWHFRTDVTKAYWAPKSGIIMYTSSYPPEDKSALWTLESPWQVCVEKSSILFSKSQRSQLFLIQDIHIRCTEVSYRTSHFPLKWIPHLLHIVFRVTEPCD